MDLYYCPKCECYTFVVENDKGKCYVCKYEYQVKESNYGYRNLCPTGRESRTEKP